VDNVFRFENFAEDWNTVSARLGIDTAPEVTNKSEHELYTTYYTKETRDIVGEAYKGDIHLFGYQYGT
jgi:hypothetical protein